MTNIAHRIRCDAKIWVDHHGSSIKWSTPPSCTCGWLKAAFDHDGVFLEIDYRDGSLSGQCYVYVVRANGKLLETENGTKQWIKFCPGCGDPVQVEAAYGQE